MRVCEGRPPKGKWRSFRSRISSSHQFEGHRRRWREWWWGGLGIGRGCSNRASLAAAGRDLGADAREALPGELWCPPTDRADVPWDSVGADSWAAAFDPQGFFERAREGEELGTRVVSDIESCHRSFSPTHPTPYSSSFSIRLTHAPFSRSPSPLV